MVLPQLNLLMVVFLSSRLREILTQLQQKRNVRGRLSGGLRHVMSPLTMSDRFAFSVAGSIVMLSARQLILTIPAIVVESNGTRLNSYVTLSRTFPFAGHNFCHPTKHRWKTRLVGTISAR